MYSVPRILGKVEVCCGKSDLVKDVQRCEFSCQSPKSGMNISRTFGSIEFSRDMEMTYIKYGSGSYVGEGEMYCVLRLLEAM
jgi:hypothetical protein